MSRVLAHRDYFYKIKKGRLISVKQSLKIYCFKIIFGFETFVVKKDYYDQKTKNSDYTDFTCPLYLLEVQLNVCG